MGCNCKSGNIADMALNGNGEYKVRKRWYVYVFEYTVKIILYLLSIIIGLPILNVYVIYLVFKLLVLNKNLDTNNLVSSLISLTKKFTPNDNNDDDDDDDDNGDYKLTDVDEIEELTIFEKK
jgi:hypothetical protein